MQCSAVQCSTMQFSEVQCSTVQCSTMQLWGRYCGACEKYRLGATGKVVVGERVKVCSNFIHFATYSLNCLLFVKGRNVMYIILSQLCFLVFILLICN